MLNDCCAAVNRFSRWSFVVLEVVIYCTALCEPQPTAAVLSSHIFTSEISHRVGLIPAERLFIPLLHHDPSLNNIQAACERRLTPEERGAESQ